MTVTAVYKDGNALTPDRRGRAPATPERVWHSGRIRASSNAGGARRPIRHGHRARPAPGRPRRLPMTGPGRQAAWPVGSRRAAPSSLVFRPDADDMLLIRLPGDAARVTIEPGSGHPDGDPERVPRRRRSSNAGMAWEDPRRSARSTPSGRRCGRRSMTTATNEYHTIAARASSSTLRDVREGRRPARLRAAHGSADGAGGFVTLASHAADRTVVTDPRGVDRSTKDDPTAQSTPDQPRIPHP